MADPFSTLALSDIFGSGSSAGSTGDLATFQKTLAANDMYRQAAAPIAAAKFNTSTWSPLQTLGVTAGQSFLSSLLNALGQRDESNQLNSVVSVLPDLYKDPASVATPEGVDAQAFGGLKAAAIEKQALIQDAIKRSLGEKGVTVNPDNTLDTTIADVFAGEKAKRANPLPAQAIQKLSTATGLLSQLEKAKSLVDTFTPNPALGGLSDVPLVGPFASKVVGSSQRAFSGMQNDTPEGVYNSLMQTVYEGVGKFVSNSARQKIIDENKDLTDPGKLGSPLGIKIAISNIEDVIKKEVEDSATGYSEQGYKKVQDALSAASTITAPNQLSKYTPQQIEFMKKKGFL
jgi:hypothetical protein